MNPGGIKTTQETRSRGTLEANIGGGLEAHESDDLQDRRLEAATQLYRWSGERHQTSLEVSVLETGVSDCGTLDTLNA